MSIEVTWYSKKEEKKSALSMTKISVSLIMSHS